MHTMYIHRNTYSIICNFPVYSCLSNTHLQLKHTLLQRWTENEQALEELPRPCCRGDQVRSRRPSSLSHQLSRCACGEPSVQGGGGERRREGRVLAVVQRLQVPHAECD